MTTTLQKSRGPITLALFATLVGLFSLAPLALAEEEPESSPATDAEPETMPEPEGDEKAGVSGESETPVPAAAEVAVPGETPPGEASTEKTKKKRKNTDFRISVVAEGGTIGVLRHKIKLGESGTLFDYRNEGGQDVLLPTWRMSAELELYKRHTFVLLYQPVNIRTESLLRRDVIIDDLTFPAGTVLRARYGFDFLRFSYLYDFYRDPEKELAIGLSLQLRIAAIEFTSLDGSLGRAEGGVGPVPILKFRGRLPIGPSLWLGTEIDGFYAKGRGVSGTSNNFEGAILDASIRAGLKVKPWLDVFVNVRYLGGGAKGVNETDDKVGDGFTENWLHTMSLSLGLIVKPTSF